MPNPIGRPSKFTEDIKKAFIQAVAMGAPVMRASQACGVDHTTIRRWLNKGEEDGHGEYYDFYMAYTEALGKRSVSLLAIIRKHAQMDWRAAAWILERLDPETFGRKYQLQGRLDVVMTQEEAERIIESNKHLIKHYLDMDKTNGSKEATGDSKAIETSESDTNTSQGQSPGTP